MKACYLQVKQIEGMDNMTTIDVEDKGITTTISHKENIGAIVTTQDKGMNVYTRKRYHNIMHVSYPRLHENTLRAIKT